MTDDEKVEQFLAEEAKQKPKKLHWREKQKLAQAAAAAQPAAPVAPPDELKGLERAAALIAQASADAALKAHEKLNPHENRAHPQKSVFDYPEGGQAHPKPPLQCIIHWGKKGNAKLLEDELTPREIELLNRLPFRTARYGRWEVIAEGDPPGSGGTTPRLHIDLKAETQDEKAMLPPSMEHILRMMLDAKPWA